MPENKFNGEYKYAIRHGYGLEGGMKNYTPHSCMALITGPAPGPLESHGCPFRHSSESHLSTALKSNYGFNTFQIKDILSSVKETKYHVACTKVYELTHGVTAGDGVGDGESVSHPNIYYSKSRALALVRAEDAKVEGDDMDVDK